MNKMHNFMNAGAGGPMLGGQSSSAKPMKAGQIKTKPPVSKAGFFVKRAQHSMPAGGKTK